MRREGERRGHMRREGEKEGLHGERTQLIAIVIK